LILVRISLIPAIVLSCQGVMARPLRSPALCVGNFSNGLIALANQT